jgi:glycosyltransferase involved in cell wall biosynthesis
MVDISMSIRISVVTATFNCAHQLPRLISSLRAQCDQDFEWIIADGGSSDDTLELVAAAKKCLQRVIVSCQVDFGIYDGLNRGIQKSSGDYYLVLGSDDVLHHDAIANYKKAIAGSQSDFVTALVRSEKQLRGPRSVCWPWLYGAFAYVSSHAVGLAVRRSLHARVGYYTCKLPIAADQLFILHAIKQGASVSFHPFEAGRFDSINGTSSRDVLGALLEGFRVQIATGQSKVIQTTLLFMRIIKNWHCLRRGL